MSYERVLVPLDFSPNSMNALTAALEHFGGSHTTLILVHVAETLALGSQHGYLSDELRGKIVDAAQAQLTQIAERCKPRCKETVCLLETGKAASAILGVAEKYRTDIVVMGAHGASGAAKALFGATAYEVARKVYCSSMVVKTEYL